MNKIHIITDSGIDMTLEEAAKFDVDVLPLHVSFESDDYLDRKTISYADFYRRLAESKTLPKTSQISPAEYEEVFEKVKAEGDTAVVLCISSKLSGCCQSAHIALDGYEDCIAIVDTLSGSAGQYILMLQALKMRDAGMDCFTIAAELEKLVPRLRVIARLDTLENLKKGGRISGASAAIGNMLSVKPVLTVRDGEVALLGKARGARSADNLLNRYVKEHGPIDFSLPLALGYSGLDQSMLETYYENSKDLYGSHSMIPIVTIGAAIGTHLGPGAVLAAFFAEN